jgi:hypothetical protein
LNATTPSLAAMKAAICSRLTALPATISSVSPVSAMISGDRGWRDSCDRLRGEEVRAQGRLLYGCSPWGRCEQVGSSGRAPPCSPGWLGKREDGREAGQASRSFSRQIDQLVGKAQLQEVLAQCLRPCSAAISPQACQRSRRCTSQ